MNQNNLLSEGFFSKLFKFLKSDSDTKKKIKSNPKLKKQLSQLNKSVSNLEKIVSDLYGSEVKLDKYKLSDFN
tara:strand:+ start:408 stop:626 length:219 start_codon:yes stop_codon:yes gene_type:complete